MRTVDYKLGYIAKITIMAALVLSCAYNLSAKDYLNPLSLNKWVDTLVILPVMQESGENYYEVGVYQFTQKLHSQLPPTTVWGYGSSKQTAHYPAYSIEAVRDVPIKVKWTNNLVDSSGNPLRHLFEVDQTIHWANPLNADSMIDQDYTGPVPIVTHLHGGENEANSDGYPTAWFTPGFKIKGKDWHQDTYTYYNTQPATTLWFHDHALGITRLNVYAGLAGFYILRDKNDNIEKKLPKGQYEIPMVIQDKMFYDDGSLAFPDDGVNPDIHPFWEPEFFGDCILVNGVIWPHLDVEPRKYRFRVLNASNARFYHMKFSNNMTFYQVGTDGGYLPQTAQMKELLLAPSERADLIVDFSNIPMGTNIILTNDAAAPFPGGDPVDSATTAQIMQFRVSKPLQGTDSTVVPNTLRAISKPTEIAKTRVLTLNEMEGENGPLGAVIDGKMFDYMTTETPVEGTTELWKFVNLTEDAHPIHVHLVQFWLQSRQEIDKEEYEKEYEEENPEIPVPMDKDYHTVDVDQFLKGEPRGPESNETGVKDVYIVYPGEVTTFLIKFAPLDSDSFAFDPTEGPGYVFHCHILDHEDNEMMRPYKVLPKSSTVVAEDQEKGSELLFTHYPNPVRNSAFVKYNLAEPERVTITVSDMLGNKLSTLVDEFQPSGEHQASFDAGSLSDGVYLYKVKAGNVIKTSRFVVMR